MPLFLSILSTTLSSICRERLVQLGTTQGYMDSALLSYLGFFGIVCFASELKRNMCTWLCVAMYRTAESTNFERLRLRPNFGLEISTPTPTPTPFRLKLHKKYPIVKTAI